MAQHQRSQDKLATQKEDYQDDNNESPGSGKGTDAMIPLQRGIERITLHSHREPPSIISDTLDAQDRDFVTTTMTQVTQGAQFNTQTQPSGTGTQHTTQSNSNNDNFATR